MALSFPKIYSVSQSNPKIVESIKSLTVSRVYRKWGAYEGLDIDEMRGIADEASIKLSRNYDPSRNYPFYDYLGSYLYNYLRNYTHREHSKETYGVQGFKRVGVCSSNVTYGFKDTSKDIVADIVAQELTNKLEEELERQGDQQLIEFYGYLKSGMNYAEAAREFGYSRMTGFRWAKKLRNIINNL